MLVYRQHWQRAQRRSRPLHISQWWGLVGGDTRRELGVNVADHGGLMVAAKDYHQEESRVLKYSCNEGQDWFDFEFIAVS